MSDTYLIRAAQIAAMPGLEKTHFLNPEAKRINKSLGDETGLTGLGFHIIEVAPGAETTEFHVHHYEDECVFVLAGTATALIGGEAHEIGPGISSATARAVLHIPSSIAERRRFA